MVSAKSIIGILEKDKLVVYFILLWAGSFFFWNIGSVADNLLNLNSAYSVFSLVGNLIELIAGVMLAMLGFKMLGAEFAPSLTKENLLAFFLLFWSISFIVWGIYNLALYGLNSVQDVARLLGALCDLGAGAVLALFSWRLFTSLIEPYAPPPPPPT